MVIKALRNNDISILTHPGDKGPFDIKAIAEVCAETDTYMEINTWHGHLTVEETTAEMERIKQEVLSRRAKEEAEKKPPPPRCVMHRGGLCVKYEI